MALILIFYKRVCKQRLNFNKQQAILSLNNINLLMQANQIYNRDDKKKDKFQLQKKSEKFISNQINLNKQGFNQSRIKNQEQKNNNVLLRIPESHIIVYQDRISYSQEQNKKKLIQSREKHQEPKGIQISNLQTNFSLQQIFLDKQIYFSNSNFAFKYIQEKRLFKIVQLIGTSKKQKISIQIKLQDKQTRNILKQILKKKMCELGFQEQFQIVKQIGKGATSRVYLVLRKSDQKKFAAKIISLSSLEQKTYNTFLNQNRILKCLKNEHIVFLEGFFISQKKQLISVLQYLQGGTLLQQLRQKKINSKKQKLKVIKDISLGIQHMRQKRIVHRDLKLQNIMIRINPNNTKDYVITDMGLSNWIGQKYILYQKCGTPGYIAPQVLTMQKGNCLLSHSTDIFSLGVLFHYILMMQPLFPYDGNTKQLLKLNKIANFNLYTENYHRLTKQEFALLRVTLQIDPEKRASTKDLLQIFILNYQKKINESQKTKRTNFHIDLQTKDNENVFSKKDTNKFSVHILSKNNKDNCTSQRSIEIIGEKNASLTKKGLNVNSSRQLNQMRSTNSKKVKTDNKRLCIQNKKSSSIDNAKKIVSRVIQKINFFSSNKQKKQSKDKTQKIIKIAI